MHNIFKYLLFFPESEETLQYGEKNELMTPSTKSTGIIDITSLVFSKMWVLTFILGSGYF